MKELIMDDIQEIITNLEAVADRMRYYNGKSLNLEEVDELIKDLGLIGDHECEYNGDAVSDARSSGFDRAKTLITDNVLKNAELKKRQDMIDAVENLEDDDE